MKTVLIANQKGGVGKTLIADELCFSLERDNIPYSFFCSKKMVEKKVEVIDSRSAYNFLFSNTHDPTHRSHSSHHLLPLSCSSP